MDQRIKYEFSASLWRYDSPAGWHFVSLPKTLSVEIREHYKWQEEGWGRMKVVAGIGKTTWDTAIWFDTKMDTYILPIKAEIRKKLKLNINSSIDLEIWV